MVGGIDPGRSGYITILKPLTDKEGAKLVDFYALPPMDGKGLFQIRQFLKMYPQVGHYYLERPGTYTRNLITLTRQHREYAELRALALLGGSECHDVKPLDWKGYYSLSRHKEESINRAAALIEGLPPLQVKDNDLAEACLIGLFGYIRSTVPPELL